MLVPSSASLTFKNLNALLSTLFILGLAIHQVRCYNSATIRDLNLDSTYFEQQAASWTAFGAFPNLTSYVTTECASTADASVTNPLLGGPYVFQSGTGSFEAVYDRLIPHQTVVITLELSIISSWLGSDKLNIYIGDNSISSLILIYPSIYAGTGDRCGNNYADLISIPMFIIGTHSEADLRLKFEKVLSTSDPFNADGQFAIRNLNINLHNTSMADMGYSGTQDHCIYRTYNIFYAADVCSCTEVNKFWDTSSCTTCHSSCESCYGDTPQNCLTCPAGASYVPSISSCITCHSSCDTCTGNSVNQCDTCPGGSYLYPDNTCNTFCEAPYQRLINGKGYCAMCHSSCETCTGTSANQCDTCPSGSYLYPNNTCSTICEARYQGLVNGKAYCNLPLLQNTLQCTELNTYNFTEATSNTIFYYYLDDGYCKPICTKPYVIEEDNESNIPICKLLLSEHDKEEIALINTIANAASITVTTGVAITTAIQPSDPNGISAGTLAKMFEYTRYFDVTHPPRLEAFYKARRTTPATVKIGPGLSNETISKFDYTRLAAVFMNNNLHSRFLVNFFDTLETLLIILGCVLLLYGIQLLVAKKLNKFLSHARMAKIALLAYLTMQFYNVYAEMLFMGTLEFMYFHGGNGVTWISFFLAIFFYAFAILVLFLHYRLIKSYQDTKAKAKDDEGVQQLEAFKKRHDKVDMLYKDFKDFTFAQQSYLMLLTARAALTGIVMAALYTSSMTQIIFHILMNLMMISYLVLKAPYKNSPTVVQQIVFELDLLIVNICFLVLAIIDAENERARVALGEIIIMAILISKFITLITLIPQVIEHIKTALSIFRERKKNKGLAVKDQSPQIIGTEGTEDLRIIHDVEEEKQEKQIESHKIKLDLASREKDDEPQRATTEDIQLIGSSKTNFGDDIREHSDDESPVMSPIMKMSVRESLMKKPSDLENGEERVQSWPRK